MFATRTHPSPKDFITFGPVSSYTLLISDITFIYPFPLVGICFSGPADATPRDRAAVCNSVSRLAPCARLNIDHTCFFHIISSDVTSVHVVLHLL
jgi:hypothetical protein